MPTFHFIFRPSSNVDKAGNISLRITHQRKSSLLVLPIKLHAQQWDKKAEQSYDKDINSQLASNLAIAKNIVSILSQKGEYDVDEIAFRFRCQLKEGKLLQFVEQLSKACHKRGQFRTGQAYLSATKRLINFCKGKTLYLSDINAPLMEAFEKAMQNEGLAPNTTSFYLRNLRTIYNRAIEIQKIERCDRSPFAHVFTGTEKTRKRALDTVQINTLHNMDVHGDKHLSFARKLFFFGFHACGMSFIDIAFLKKTDIKHGIIRYRRKKTGKIIEVCITKELQKLIDYFYPLNRNSNYLLPIIVDKNKEERLQYENALRLQNKRLKVLGSLSTLDMNLSTHVCRHSWASLARNLNIPLPVISESLGHSDEKTTIIYLASFDQKVLDRASEQVSSLIRSNSNPVYNFV